MKTGREALAFVVPCYNCASTIGSTVESIFDGNYESGDQIILVDDCSTDRTPRVLEKIHETRPAVSILKHSHNRGTAAAGRNTGIEFSKHQLVFCLDADNILVGQSVGPLIAHLRKARADAAAFGELHYFRKDPNQITHKWHFKEKITFADALAGSIWPGSSGNYLFTRESWKRAGRYYEPVLENQTVDSWAFAIRQLATGTKMVTLPDSWYYHRYGHHSHYVRNLQRGNQSMAALIGLIPVLDKIREEDVDYIFSKTGRTNWYSALDARPLRVKSGRRGVNGQVELLPGFRHEGTTDPWFARIRKMLSQRGSGKS